MKAPKKTTAKRPVGRPPKSNKSAIQSAICKLTSTTTMSLHTVLKELAKKIDDVPHYDTIRDWIVTDKAFSDKYAKAKGEQLEMMAEELIDIADDSSLDVAFTEEGKPFVDREHINRSRLRVDTRKWLLSKLVPKKYGDKHEVTGGDGGPVEFLFKVIYDDAPKGNNGD